jgi:hypothetical protein
MSVVTIMVFDLGLHWRFLVPKSLQNCKNLINFQTINFITNNYIGMGIGTHTMNPEMCLYFTFELHISFVYYKVKLIQYCLLCPLNVCNLLIMWSNYNKTCVIKVNHSIWAWPSFRGLGLNFIFKGQTLITMKNGLKVSP